MESIKDLYEGDKMINPNSSFAEDDIEDNTRTPLRDNNGSLSAEKRGRGRTPGSKKRKSQGNKIMQDDSGGKNDAQKRKRDVTPVPKERTKSQGDKSMRENSSVVEDDIEDKNDVDTDGQKRARDITPGPKKRTKSQEDKSMCGNSSIVEGDIEDKNYVYTDDQKRDKDLTPGSKKKKSQGDKNVHEKNSSVVEDDGDDKNGVNETHSEGSLKRRKKDDSISFISEADGGDDDSYSIIETTEGNKNKLEKDNSFVHKDVSSEGENMDINKKINRHSADHKEEENAPLTVQKRGRGRPVGSKKRSISQGDMTANPNSSFAEDNTVRTPLREDNVSLPAEKRGRGRPQGSKNRKPQGDKAVVEKISKVKKSDELIKRPKDKISHSKSFIKLSFKKKDSRKSISDSDSERNLSRANDISTHSLEIPFKDGEELQTDGEGNIKKLDINESQNENQKRGRGRPKKISSSQNTVESLNNDAQIPIQKRRAGRPLGAKNKEKIKSASSQKPIEEYGSRHSLSRNKINQMNKSMTEKKKGEHVNKTKGKPRNDKEKSTKFLHVRKIPKERLEESLTILKDPKHPVWEEMNTSCNSSIHRFWEAPRMQSCQQRLRLKYARQFLIRRDWVNLSKVLCIASQDKLGTKNYYPLLSKYGAICLAHTDKDQFNTFMQLLVDTDDGATVLKKCTQIGEILSDDE